MTRTLLNKPKTEQNHYRYRIFACRKYIFEAKGPKIITKCRFFHSETKKRNLISINQILIENKINSELNIK